MTAPESGKAGLWNILDVCTSKAQGVVISEAGKGKT